MFDLQKSSKKNFTKKFFDQKFYNPKKTKFKEKPGFFNLHWFFLINIHSLKMTSWADQKPDSDDEGGVDTLSPSTSTNIRHLLFFNSEWNFYQRPFRLLATECNVPQDKIQEKLQAVHRQYEGAFPWIHAFDPSTGQIHNLPKGIKGEELCFDATLKYRHHLILTEEVPRVLRTVYSCFKAPSKKLRKKADHLYAVRQEENASAASAEHTSSNAAPTKSKKKMIDPNFNPFSVLANLEVE